MGILDSIYGQDQEKNGILSNALLQLASGLLTPQSRGGGLGAGLGAFGQAVEKGQQLADQRALSAIQRKQLGLQTNELERSQNEAGQIRQAARDSAGGPGGFEANFISQVMGINPMLGLELQQRARAANAPVMVPHNTVAIDPVTRQPIIRNVDQWRPVGKNDRGQEIIENALSGDRKAVGSGPLVNVNTGKEVEDKYLQTSQTKLAEADSSMYDRAVNAAEANRSLTRMRQIIAQPGGVSAGPLGPLEATARNLTAQLGMPLNKALDRNNARFTAEFTSRLANKVLAGGRSITDTDRDLLGSAFPSFKAGQGITLADLPAFIDQLETMNNDAIDTWRARYNTLPVKYKNQYPATFGEYRQAPGADYVSKEGAPQSTDLNDLRKQYEAELRALRGK